MYTLYFGEENFTFYSYFKYVKALFLYQNIRNKLKFTFCQHAKSAFLYLNIQTVILISMQVDLKYSTCLKLLLRLLFFSACVDIHVVIPNRY